MESTDAYIKDENAKMLFLTTDGYYVKSNDKIKIITKNARIKLKIILNTIKKK